MKDRIKELGDAINHTLAHSEQITDVIERIKGEGYDVFLVLEATVGVNRPSGQGRPSQATPDFSSQSMAMDMQPAELTVDEQDLRFLKSLRISVGDAE